MRRYDIPLKGGGKLHFRVRLTDDEYNEWKSYLQAGVLCGDQPAPCMGELVDIESGQVCGTGFVSDYILDYCTEGLALSLEITDVDGGWYESVPIR